MKQLISIKVCNTFLCLFSYHSGYEHQSVPEEFGPRASAGHFRERAGEKPQLAMNTMFEAMQMQSCRSAHRHRVSASPRRRFHPDSLQWSTVSLLCLIAPSGMLMVGGGLMMGGGLKVLGSELITPRLAGPLICT